MNDGACDSSRITVTNTLLYDHNFKSKMKNTKIMTESYSEKTQQILDEIEAIFGVVPNFFKAQASINSDWLELNWNREKKIMLSEGVLDRKTKELLAMAVSLVNQCEYCALAHESMANMVGATSEEVNEAKQVIELLASFNSIADSLRITCDMLPEAYQNPIKD